MKAQQRISEKNDILGMNKFAIFHTVNDECLATIALDSGINFGDSMHVVKSNIQTLKAREAAQSLICIAKDRLDKEKVEDRLPLPVEIEGCVSPHDARGKELCAVRGDDTILPSKS